MKQEFVLASDLGSGGCKTVILDKRGKVVAAAQQEYPSNYPQPGWAEQDPEDWYRAFCHTVRAVLDQSAVPPVQIAGVGIVGVTHNTVLLDEHDRPLAPAILIFDNRSTAQVEQILARWGEEVCERTLNDVSPLWSWPQLLWVRQHRPEVWKAARRILFQKDYVRHRLATAPVTDTIDASGSLLFDPREQKWIEAFCRDLGLEPEQLPYAAAPMEVVSGVSHQGAADTGLAEGTPVIAGATDTAAEVLGAGALRPGSAVVKLASVGRIAIVNSEPVCQAHILNYCHVLDGLWYPGTASKSAASAYRWLRDALWPESNAEDVYRLMDEAAAQAPAGSEGLLFHPHLMGEWAPYWDERMRGNFIGLTARHNRAHLTRAVLEGVAFALKDALSELQTSGQSIEQIRLIGQGSKSRLWGQIVANALNCSLHIPEQPDAAYGAALITAMAVNLIERKPEALETIITLRQSLSPEEKGTACYARLFDLYRETDRALRPIAGRLHDFEQELNSQKEEQSR